MLYPTQNVGLNKILGEDQRADIFEGALNSYLKLAKTKPWNSSD